MVIRSLDYSARAELSSSCSLFIRGKQLSKRARERERVYVSNLFWYTSPTTTKFWTPPLYSVANGFKLTQLVITYICVCAQALNSREKYSDKYFVSRILFVQYLNG